MTAHRTKGQQRALRELLALALTATDFCEMIAQAGEESDDRPREWLTTFARWARSEETGAQLAARTRALNAWGDSLTKGDSRGDQARLLFRSALAWLIDAREDLLKNPGHSWHTGRVCHHLAATIVPITSDPMDVAAERVRRCLDAHRAKIAVEWPMVRQRKAAARRKTDNVAAEQGLALPRVK